MKKIRLSGDGFDIPFIPVRGTGEGHFRFGLENVALQMRVNDFYISQLPVTQRLWHSVMDASRPLDRSASWPVVRVSFSEITSFLEKLNRSTLVTPMIQQLSWSPLFRLPSEAEWEYAARGGPYWGDYFLFAGSDNLDDVGWYKGNSGKQLHPAGLKKPNQLGIHDMCGNIWEWCADYFHHDHGKLPLDGSPCLEYSEFQSVRGGSFTNYAIHCTVMKRYEIHPAGNGDDLGFRLVFSINKTDEEKLA